MSEKAASPRGDSKEEIICRREPKMSIFKVYLTCVIRAIGGSGALTSNCIQLLEVEAGRWRAGKEVNVGECEESAVAVVVLLWQRGDLSGRKKFGREFWILIGVFLVPSICDRALLSLL